MSARRARQQREEYLLATLRACEERLRKLGKPTDAWRHYQVLPDGSPRPGMMKNLGELRDELGPEWDVVRKRRKIPGDTPAFDRLHAAARKLTEQEAITYGEALAIIFERQPKLYAEYEREKARTLGESRHRPAYRHAEMAALMKYALQRLDEPEAMFAAALALGEYHQFDWQEERKRRELDRLAERHPAEARRRARKGGESKRGVVAEHTAIICKVATMHRALTLSALLDSLRDEAEMDSLLGTFTPQLRIVAVEVDDDDCRINFQDAHDHTVRTMSFAAAAKALERAKTSRKAPMRVRRASRHRDK